MNFILIFMMLDFIMLLLKMGAEYELEGVWGVPYDQALTPEGAGSNCTPFF
jgi:hypothetical protein